jgi:hypothetical protein
MTSTDPSSFCVVIAIFSYFVLQLSLRWSTQLLFRVPGIFCGSMIMSKLADNRLVVCGKSDPLERSIVLKVLLIRLCLMLEPVLGSLSLLAQR